MTFGGLRTMWVLVMFDLPTDTAAARRSYREFRSFLLNDGFLLFNTSDRIQAAMWVIVP